MCLLLTLLLRDGDREEGDEGGQRQQGEEQSHEEEEPEPLQPGLPVALEVHDVGDQSPEGQHTYQEEGNMDLHKTIVLLLDTSARKKKEKIQSVRENESKIMSRYRLGIWQKNAYE